MSLGNPLLNEQNFSDASRGRGLAVATGDQMTMGGTVAKTGFLLALAVGTATFTWQMAASGNGSAGLWTFGGGIAGLVLVLVAMFKKTWSPFIAPLYAAVEGLFLGGVSVFVLQRYGHETSGAFALGGVVGQAIGLTLSITAAMLILYAFRIIKVTEKLKAGIMMATVGAVMFYVAVFVLGMLGVNIGGLVDTSPLSIGISAVIVVIASFALLIDFDFIEQASNEGAPKYMEWFAALCLMVTLVWLYLEVLKLVAKLQSRD